MKRYGTAAIVTAAVITTGLAVMCHESGHILAGKLAGGSPTLMTATEVRGNFDSLSPAGFVALGLSGSVVNALFCALGWWALRRRPASAEGQLTAWFFFAVNGMLVATAMMGESLVGFGDWMTILRPLPRTGLLRGVAAVVGTAAVAFMVRRGGAALSRLVPPGEPSRRKAEALRVVGIGAATATVLIVGGSVANPVGTTRGMLLALAAGLGPFIPIGLGVRFVSKVPSEQTGEIAHGGWPWRLAAAVTTAVLWFVVCPGLDLSKLP